ncbi:hypothetical protein B0H17DRAFT_371406 [Mycena rosella]|uniref:Uncharacterized protein n=1 Tax=Mycena rosella TaxID=1033263 RepID=A0AAD7MBP5_MYCRO|nr:hypothetical protein B0H17DRAFT_371406 [Mycena rosella]
MDPPPCLKCGAPTRSRNPERPIPFALGARHHQLLNSNEPPLETDLLSMQSFVSAHLSSLDSEISGLRARLKQLEDKRAELSSHLMQNTTILAPLRRIPPEVLGEIFRGRYPPFARAWMEAGST